MNVLDIIIGIVLVLFALAGLMKGLIIEAFFLLSFVAGAYGAMYFSDAVADWMSDFININEDYLTIVSFIVTFIIFMILMKGENSSLNLSVRNLMMNLEFSLHFSQISERTFI